MEVQPAIQCDLQATVTLLTNFPAKIDPFPITYLGIPLGIKKLKKIDMQPLIDKVAKRLPSWKANLLNKAGRTVLIKSTLSAIPTHTVVRCLSRSLLGQSSALIRFVKASCGLVRRRLRMVTVFLPGRVCAGLLILVVWGSWI